MASSVSLDAYQAPMASSIGEVEQLVQNFYLPGSPKKIGKIQETLQRLQRSAEGWQLADALLGSNDDKVRFFGALTFTIKINQDWGTLSPEEADSLLMRLLSWLVYLVSHNESALVVRKLCASLVAYFLRPQSAWDHCLRHVACSFYHVHAVPTESLSRYPSTAGILSNLSEAQAVAMLWFSSMLVEELVKTDNDSMQTHKYYERLGSNLQDAVAMMRHCLLQSSQNKARLCQEGIKCFQSWVDYSHRAWVNTAAALDPLKEITQLVIPSIVNEDTFEVAVDCLTDILTNFCAFLTTNDLRSLTFLLCGEYVEQRLMELKSGNYDTDHLAIGRLLLAFGDATVQDLAKNYEDMNSQQILQMLHSLLTCHGHAVAEDEICAPALEFWNMYTEFMIDSLFADGEKKANWIDPAIKHCLQAIEECWVKLRFPAQEEAETWDSEVRIGFKAFRADVKDLLQASYTLIGVEILEKFANLALESLEARAWADLESTLFCLNALSDCTADEDPVERTLVQLFGSPMFRELSNNESMIPAKTKQTAVHTLGNYTAFFERHTDFLPSALDFLFTSLQAPTLAVAASKSILALCSSCRKALVSELGTFIRQYEAFLAWPSADIGTKEKVIGAIAAIVQAISSEEDKIEPMERLLLFIEADMQSSVTVAGVGQPENAQSTALCALRCLASMGKALQAPDDLPIELDGDTPQNTIWDHGRGAALQARIVRCVEVLPSIFREDGEIMEAACDVLRTGYKETSPGPFVFAPEVTVNFVSKCTLDTPRLDYVLNTACVLLSSHNSDISTRMINAANSLLIHTLNIIHLLDVDPAKDPEVASSCTDLTTKLLHRHSNLLLNPALQSPISDLFTFTLRCLPSTEILPKRSAASFWTTFLLLPSSQDQQPHSQPQYPPPPTSSPQTPTIATITTHLIPSLASALIHAIAATASRSDLDALSDPLKKLIFKHPRAAKQWLEAAVTDEERFPAAAAEKVSLGERKGWVRNVLSLRGAKATNVAVKEFWIACRGAGLGYVS